MEALNSAQQSTGKDLKKILNDYIKQSPDKKTITNLKETLVIIDNLWHKFESNDDEIRNKFGHQTGHLYFTTDYYGKVKESYDRVRKEVVELIEHVRQTNTTIVSKVQKASTASISTVSQPNPTQHDKTKINSEHSNQENSFSHIITKQKYIMLTLRHALSNIQMDGNQTKQYFDVKLETIKNYWKQIEETYNLIWETVDESNTEYNLEEYFELESRVQDIIIKMKQFIENQNTINNRPISNHNNETVNQSFMRLPKIELPKFNGDYLKWKQFHDLFTQMVHNQNLSNSQKMWYLKMNLVGEAEKLIRHLTLTDNNYEIAWNSLNERYENKRLLVTALLDKLMAQPKIMTESASALKT